MLPMPLIVPLGDQALLIRFADAIDNDANAAAVGFAHELRADPPQGVLEIVPNLVSVLLRYDPVRIRFSEVSGEIRLRLALAKTNAIDPSEPRRIPVRYGGEDGPDLVSVAEASGLDPDAFVAKHSEEDLRVLAIGFAPGFAYCGFHKQLTPLPRRTELRPLVPAGTILYAAGQTAITATPIPTGWNVLGRTDFRNFDVGSEPPVHLLAGDSVRFVAA